MSLKPFSFSSSFRNCVRRLSKSSIIRSELNVGKASAVEGEGSVSGRPLIPGEIRNKKPERLLIPSRLRNEILLNPELERLRIVPALKTFYGGNPAHEENLNLLNGLIRKYGNLLTRVMSEKEIQNYKYISFEEYKERILAGNRLKPIHYKELTLLLHRLRSIDPELMPKEVSETLNDFMSRSNREIQITRKVKQLDDLGRAICTGKRKRAVATVYLTRGEGESIINGRSLIEFFPRDADRRRIAYPFQVVSQEGQYNIFATVQGGGITGQAEAIMYGIAKCLVVFNPLLKPRLSKAGLMTRDARKVERKKPGKVKARKSPTWVKR